jgi:hypothetical protein
MDAFTGGNLIEIAIGHGNMPLSMSKRSYDGPASAVEHDLSADEPFEEAGSDGSSLILGRKAPFA